MVSNLQYALGYAKLGWAVFPCNGKIPACGQGFKDATTDTNMLIKWWTINPDYNIGIATGKVSGIVVLDIDKPDLEYKGLKTPNSKTGGGGRHYFFKYNEKVKTCVGLFDKVDVRADGGYVIVPPSETDGIYEWVDSPTKVKLAEAPEYMVKEEKKLADPIPEKIPQGQRNEILTSLAGSMRRRGASPGAIYLALSEENKKCDPPLPETHLKVIADSVGRYTPEQEIVVDKDKDYWDWEAYVDESMEVKSKMDASKVCEYHIPYLQDALTGIAPSELVVIGADAGSGKTKLAMDIGLHNASKGKRVALFALEGDRYEIAHREIYRRMCIALRKQGRSTPTYNQYIFNTCPECADVEAMVCERVKKDYQDRLLIYTRRNPLDKHSVVKHLAAIHDEVDMVIIDHLHYFEFLSGLEHSEITDIMKQVKMLTDKYRIPIVLVSHLRKKGKDRVFPDDDDFHGSSNIAKQSNTNIIISPVTLEDFPYAEQVETNRFSTGIRISKARSGIQRRIIGVVDFDLTTRSYCKDYRIAEIKRDSYRIV